MCITLDNRSAKFTKNAIKNDELRSFANMLAEDAMNIRANLLHMSAIMATIAARRDSGILEEFDNSIVTFAENRLGIKKSQVYSMVQVGATFLDSAGKSILPEKGGKWNNTQFMALLPMAGTGKNKKSPEDTEKHDTIKGTKIAEISVWQLIDGSIHVCFDGDEKDFTNENISAIVNMLTQATNFKN